MDATELFASDASVSRMALLVAVTGLVLLGETGQVVAADGVDTARTTLDRALASYDRGDHDGAVSELRTLAIGNDPEAQYQLALIHDYGPGARTNEVVAALWYRRAAENGHVDAQVQLGLVYQTGEGLARDPVRAAYWYRRAALQNDAEAQLLLGVLYTNDFEPGYDPIRALAWIEMSAAQGNDTASQRKLLMSRELTPIQVAEAARLAQQLKAGMLAQVSP